MVLRFPAALLLLLMTKAVVMSSPPPPTVSDIVDLDDCVKRRALCVVHKNCLAASPGHEWIRYTEGDLFAQCDGFVAITPLSSSLWRVQLVGHPTPPQLDGVVKCDGQGNAVSLEPEKITARSHKPPVAAPCRILVQSKDDVALTSLLGPLVINGDPPTDIAYAEVDKMGCLHLLSSSSSSCPDDVHCTSPLIGETSDGEQRWSCVSPATLHLSPSPSSWSSLSVGEVVHCKEGAVSSDKGGGASSQLSVPTRIACRSNPLTSCHLDQIVCEGCSLEAVGREVKCSNNRVIRDVTGNWTTGALSCASISEQDNPLWETAEGAVVAVDNVKCVAAAACQLSQLLFDDCGAYTKGKCPEDSSCTAESVSMVWPQARSGNGHSQPVEVDGLTCDNTTGRFLATLSDTGKRIAMRPGDKASCRVWEEPSPARSFVRTEGETVASFTLPALFLLTMLVSAPLLHSRLVRGSLALYHARRDDAHQGLLAKDMASNTLEAGASEGQNDPSVLSRYTENPPNQESFGSLLLSLLLFWRRRRRSDDPSTRSISARRLSEKEAGGGEAGEEEKEKLLATGSASLPVLPEPSATGTAGTTTTNSGQYAPPSKEPGTEKWEDLGYPLYPKDRVAEAAAKAAEESSQQQQPTNSVSKQLLSPSTSLSRSGATNITTSTSGGPPIPPPPSGSN